MNQNPFASPPDTTGAAGPDEEGLAKARVVRVGEEVIQWEKLRWVYNGILVLVTLMCLLARADWFTAPLALAATLGFGAVAANICYSVGTILGAYLAWIGFNNRHARLIVFGLGTSFASLLTALTILRSRF